MKFWCLIDYLPPWQVIFSPPYFFWKFFLSTNQFLGAENHSSKGVYVIHSLLIRYINPVWKVMSLIDKPRKDCLELTFHSFHFSMVYSNFKRKIWWIELDWHMRVTVSTFFMKSSSKWKSCFSSKYTSNHLGNTNFSAATLPRSKSSLNTHFYICSFSFKDIPSIK